MLLIAYHGCKNHPSCHKNQTYIERVADRTKILILSNCQHVILSAGPEDMAMLFHDAVVTCDLVSEVCEE